jgi:hypothetical protein
LCKEALAKRITDTFPHLGQTLNPHCDPYSMYFHRVKKNNKMKNGGKIECKVAKLAAKLPQSKKKKIARVTKQVPLDFSVDNVDLVCILRIVVFMS